MTTAVCYAASTSQSKDSERDQETIDRSYSYDSSITISGVSPKDTKWLMVVIASDEKKSQQAIQTAYWPANAPLPQVYIEEGAGKYTINVYSSDAAQSSEAKYKYVKTLKVENKDSRKIRYLLPSLDIQSNHPDIQSLAAHLTQGLTSDYEKALAVYDWMTANVHYDRTGVEENTYAARPNDAVSVLNSKLAVCAGYSNLTAALLRSVGIRSRVVLGKLIGQDDDKKTKAEICKTTNIHAWNEAFIDKRWVSMDSTSDSGMTRLIGNEFVRVQTPGKRSNFDPKPADYRKTHMKCSEETEEESMSVEILSADVGAVLTPAAGGSPAALQKFN